MRRQPSLHHGRLWRALLAVLVLGGLGIWHGGHCPGDTFAGHASATIAGPRADVAIVPAQAAAVGVARTIGHRESQVGGAPEVPDTAAGDCHLVTSTEPAATRTSVTGVAPPGQASSCVVIGAAARRPVPRLLTGRPLTEIGVSRT